MSALNLNEVVLNALDLHASYELPQLQFNPAQKRLVIASGNALPTGRILFADEPVLFCNEGEYERVLDRETDVDAAVVISASGTKHAPIILEALLARGITADLVTCNAQSPAAALLAAEHVFETRSHAEPITYNTSTYLGMVLSKTREEAGAIKQFILDRIDPLIPDFTQYEAFYLMVRPEFEVVCEMYVTKFDELFGGRVNGRCYTTEQTLHAKTVVPWEKELFISFGHRNEDFGSARLDIPFPSPAGVAASIAIGYYVIGHIQAQLPPWFKQHMDEYERIQAALFEKS